MPVAASPVIGLTPQQVKAYERDGFLILRQLFKPAEIAELAVECDALFGRKDLIDAQNIRCRWQNHHETAECRFDCFDPVIDIGPVCRRFAYDRRILEPLQAVYDDEAFLFKDKLIFKPPGATGYALHQDYISWPEFPETFI